MKKTIILFALITLFYSSISYGQDSTKTRIKEYYLTLAGVSPLNIQLKYKRQIAKKTYFKIGLIDLSASQNEIDNHDYLSFPSSTTILSAGAEVGIEFRKQLTKKFALFHGPNIRFGYNRRIDQTKNPSIPLFAQKHITETYNSSIPYTLGLLFNLNSNILIGAEINPSINFYYHGNSNGSNSNPSGPFNYGYGIGFNNKFAQLSIVYRL